MIKSNELIMNWFEDYNRQFFQKMKKSWAISSKEMKKEHQKFILDGVEGELSKLASTILQLAISKEGIVELVEKALEITYKRYGELREILAIQFSEIEGTAVLNFKNLLLERRK